MSMWLVFLHHFPALYHLHAFRHAIGPARYLP